MKMVTILWMKMVTRSLRGNRMKKIFLGLFCVFLFASTAIGEDKALNGFTNITESSLTASDEFIVWNGAAVKNITVENLWDWYVANLGSESFGSALTAGSVTYSWNTGSGTDASLIIADDSFTFNKKGVFTALETSAADGTHHINVNNTAENTTSSPNDIWSRGGVVLFDAGDSNKSFAFLESPAFTTPNIGAATATSLAFGADPGDSGAVRFSNNTALSWEQSTPGTDIFIALDNSDILQVGQNAAQINLGTSGTGNVFVTGDLTVTGSDISVGAAGVKLTGDGDGQITFASLGGGNSEDLSVNLDDTANTVVFASSTGVTDLNFSALNLVTTGNITGKIPMITKTDNYTLGADSAQEAYGYMLWISGDSKIVTLPAVVAGMSVCVYSTDATAKVVDPNASDGIRNGTATRNADGHKITSGGTAGDFVCLVADSADGWTVLGKSGTWTDE